MGTPFTLPSDALKDYFHRESARSTSTPLPTPKPKPTPTPTPRPSPSPIPTPQPENDADPTTNPGVVAGLDIIIGDDGTPTQVPPSSKEAIQETIDAITPGDGDGAGAGDINVSTDPMVLGGIYNLPLQDQMLTALSLQLEFVTHPLERKRLKQLASKPDMLIAFWALHDIAHSDEQYIEKGRVRDDKSFFNRMTQIFENPDILTTVEAKERVYDGYRKWINIRQLYQDNPQITIDDNSEKYLGKDQPINQLFFYTQDQVDQTDLDQAVSGLILGSDRNNPLVTEGTGRYRNAVLRGETEDSLSKWLVDNYPDSAWSKVAQDQDPWSKSAFRKHEDPNIQRRLEEFKGPLPTSLYKGAPVPGVSEDFKKIYQAGAAMPGQRSAFADIGKRQGRKTASPMRGTVPGFGNIDKAGLGL